MQMERFTYNPQFLNIFAKSGDTPPPFRFWHGHGFSPFCDILAVRRITYQLPYSFRSKSKKTSKMNSHSLAWFECIIFIQECAGKNVVIFKMLVEKIVRNGIFRTSPKIWRTRAVYTWVIRSSTLHITACANKLRLWKKQFNKNNVHDCTQQTKNTPPPPNETTQHTN